MTVTKKSETAVRAMPIKKIKEKTDDAAKIVEKESWAAYREFVERMNKSSESEIRLATAS